jgi:hypothetical protein
MGLDQYLIGKKYFFRDDKAREKLQKIVDGPFKAESVEVEIGYWRKASAIHKWFVDNVQDGNDDCGTYYVTEDQLKKLLDLTNKVLESKENGTDAKLLPTTEGFFFGGTEYDDWYYEQLHNTKEIIEKYLNYKNRDQYSLYYHSSW